MVYLVLKIHICQHLQREHYFSWYIYSQLNRAFQSHSVVKGRLIYDTAENLTFKNLTFFLYQYYFTITCEVYEKQFNFKQPQFENIQINSHFSAFIGYKPFFSMRYYMCYLEARAVSTFDPKGNRHQSEEKENTQPSPQEIAITKTCRLVGCKNCTWWKWGRERDTEKGFNGKWKRKDCRKWEERSEHLEEKRALAVC